MVGGGCYAAIGAGRSHGPLHCLGWTVSVCASRPPLYPPRLRQGPRRTPQPHLLCELHHHQAPLASGFPLGSAGRGHCRESGRKKEMEVGEFVPGLPPARSLRLAEALYRAPAPVGLPLLDSLLSRSQSRPAPAPNSSRPKGCCPPPPLPLCLLLCPFAIPLTLTAPLQAALC